MTVLPDALRIAVVGLGPRGLGALEALAARLSGERPVQVDVFDPFPEPGAGPNFSPAESGLCLLNIPVRDLDIRPPAFSRCGGYADWAQVDPQADSFPTRPDLGRYLEHRLGEVLRCEAPAIACHSDRVDRLEPCEGGWRVLAGGQWSAPYQEVLLALGQPEVSPDSQLSHWQSSVSAPCELAQAYPLRDLVTRARDWRGKTVAIRGLGLSTFDVIRALSSAQGGQFAAQGYSASGQEPVRILPFSLDGKPPFPKPETGQLDDRYAPTEEETQRFADAVARVATTDPRQAAALVTAALAPVVARVLHVADTADDASAVAGWLESEWSAPGSQEGGAPIDILRQGIGLAEGRLPPTIGYAVGQVWRKWQDTLRAGFNPATTAPETARRLIDFDEGLKRYSYGPPVSAARELQALVTTGLVDLTFAADPEIDLNGDGWRLRRGGATARASVMIDAVLPSPDLVSVADPLVTDLVAQGWLTPVAEGFAARTDADGQVLGRNGRRVPGLCLLGRMALGSVIAVDSLHDCFGEASHRWARGVLDRMG